MITKRETIVASGTPESFGWVRVPSRDTPGSICYERPDGSLQMWERGRKPVVVVRFGDGSVFKS